MTSLLEGLFKLRAHLGEHQSKLNKEMSPYLYGTFQGFSIIDLEKTVPSLITAFNVVDEVVSRGGLILFVGVSDRSVETRLRKLGYPYTTHRWVAGTLTNFSQVVQSIERLNQIKSAHGGVIPRSHRRMLRGVMEAYFGLSPLVRLPDLLICFKPNRNKIVLAEARNLQIPIIAVMDTNSNASSIEYPVPSNGAYECLSTVYGHLFLDVIGRASKSSFSPNVEM